MMGYFVIGCISGSLATLLIGVVFSLRKPKTTPPITPKANFPRLVIVTRPRKLRPQGGCKNGQCRVRQIKSESMK